MEENEVLVENIMNFLDESDDVVEVYDNYESDE